MLPDRSRQNRETCRKIPEERKGKHFQSGISASLFCKLLCVKERKQDFQVVRQHISLPWTSAFGEEKEQCQTCSINISWLCMNLSHLFSGTHFRRNKLFSGSNFPAICISLTQMNRILYRKIEDWNVQAMNIRGWLIFSLFCHSLPSNFEGIYNQLLESHRIKFLPNI